MSSTFLETVLPSQGTYCAVSIDDVSKGIREHKFVGSIEEVQHWADKFTQAGLGAFMALATFSESSRKAVHATALRALFIDLDTGPNKAYPDVDAALQGLVAFVKQVHLPRPWVVLSGGGVHAYWAFDRDVPTSEWLPLARAFKKFCVSHKLGIDLAVTADAARILRVPGSVNFKNGDERPCQIVSAAKRCVTTDEMWALLPAPAAPEVDLSAAKAFGADAITMALARGEDRQPSSFKHLLQVSREGRGCAQMVHAQDKASVLEEPLWRAMLSIAVNCTDGATAIHDMSAAHPEYTTENTEAKAEAVRDKPYTCQWYRDNSPSQCEGCVRRCVSPIQLGAYTPMPAAPAEMMEPVVSVGGVALTSITVPEYPFPYFHGPNFEVHKREMSKDGVPEAVEIYPYPLYVVSRFYDSDAHGDGEGELVSIALHLPRDGIRQFHAPVAHLLSTDRLRDVLTKHGVVALPKQMVNIMAYLASSIKHLQSSFASNKTRNQMGWTPEHTFVVGELEYTPSGPKLAPAASGTRQMAPLFHAKGSLDEWRSVVNFYNHLGMEGHAFAFLVGAGSCLLKLLNNTQVRGAVLNLVSNGSGTGKTTVQMAINSLFGHPSELLMEAKDTPAARFHRLGTLNSICMTVDELTNATGEQLSALVYGSTSGRAPHRMEAQSNKLRANNTTWCSFTVTSSNAVMSDALAAHRSAVEGELKRVIDLRITIPQSIPKAESDALFSKLAVNYGIAGPMLVQHVVNNREIIEAELKVIQLQVDRDAQFERNDRFYSAVCAPAVAVGRIGNALGLWNLDIERIYKWAIAQVQTVRDTNANSVGTAATLAVETLARFISDNVGNALIIDGHRTHGAPSAPVQVPRGPLRLRYEPDTKLMFVLASDLRTFFVDRRVDFKASLEEFKNSGALICPKPGELVTTKRIAAGAVGGMAAPAARCYAFNAELLGLAPAIESHGAD